MRCVYTKSPAVYEKGLRCATFLFHTEFLSRTERYLLCTLSFRPLVITLIQYEKGVFSKPSGKHIITQHLCYLSQRPQMLATCLFFDFAELYNVSAKLDNIDIRHLMFFDFLIYHRFKGRTLIKYLIQEVPAFCDFWFQTVIMKCGDHEFRGLFLV